MTQSRDEFKIIPSKDKTHQVSSIEELKQIINYAKKENLIIRTIGSGHSPSASIFPEQEKHIKIKLAGDFKKIKSFTEEESKDSALVTVGAGCYLGVNPSDKESTLENSFNYQIDLEGFALPTLGGISHQTIAGFLSTSSSGGTAKHNIADAIEAIGFIDGTGKYHNVKKGDPLFNAVGVSMGLLGVITDVSFRLQKRYLVQGSEINQEVKDSCLAGDSKSDYAALDKTLFEENEYGHINWFAQKYVDSISLWTGKQNNDFKTPEKEYKHALSSKGMAFLASSDMAIINVLNESKIGDSDKTQRLIGGLLKPFVNPKDRQDFRQIWYKALPIDDQANVDGLFDIAFSELWFPRSQLNDVMRKMKYVFETNPKAAGNFIVELYAAKESPFLLSPSYGHDALRVDLYWWKKNPCGDANKYFGQFYEALKGGQYHWGKYLPNPGEKYGEYTFNPEDLQKNYPGLPEFLKWREKCDPHQLFVSDYWRKYLSIPAPKPEPSWLSKAISYVPGLNLFSEKTKENKEDAQQPALAFPVQKK